MILVHRTLGRVVAIPIIPCAEPNAPPERSSRHSGWSVLYSKTVFHLPLTLSHTSACSDQPMHEARNSVSHSLPLKNGQ